jgi:hypothetical protein
MAPIDQKLELLKHVPLFKDVSRHDLEQIGQLAEEVDVPAGQVLTREGAPGSEFFVIVDGNVRIDVHGETVRRWMRAISSARSRSSTTVRGRRPRRRRPRQSCSSWGGASSVR